MYNDTLYKPEQDNVMNSIWQAFIEEQDQVTSVLDSTCAKINLSYLGLIKISGEDKQTFLQGQLTNDTRSINETASQLSSYCTPKGRMLANFRVFQSGDDWYLVIPANRLDAILKRLKMFVLRSQVSIEDASNDLVAVGLLGECIKDKLNLTLPDTADSVTHDGQFSFIRVSEHQQRYLCIGPTEPMQQLWNQLDEIDTASEEKWRLEDIRAGIPTVFEDTQEAFIPQMTNMQLLNGVSFTKGCYTGQEVVARMQYLGKLKRRMYPVSFESEQPISPGAEVFSATSQSGQGAGKMVDAISTGNNRYEGLAVLEIKEVEDSNRLQLIDKDGPVLEITAPPYDFEIDEN
jgi:tRNA-modifying protein YgfZ